MCERLEGIREQGSMFMKLLRGLIEKKRWEIWQKMWVGNRLWESQWSSQAKGHCPQEEFLARYIWLDLGEWLDLDTERQGEHIRRHYNSLMRREPYWRKWGWREKHRCGRRFYDGRDKVIIHHLDIVFFDKTWHLFFITAWDLWNISVGKKHFLPSHFLPYKVKKIKDILKLIVLGGGRGYICSSKGSLRSSSDNGRLDCRHQSVPTLSGRIRQILGNRMFHMLKTEKHE